MFKNLWIKLSGVQTAVGFIMLLGIVESLDLGLMNYADVFYYSIGAVGLIGTGIIGIKLAEDLHNE